MGKAEEQVKEAKAVHDKEVNYMRMALGLQGIAVTHRIADVVITTHKGIMEKGGDFSVRDAADIEFLIKKEYEHDGTSD